MLNPINKLKFKTNENYLIKFENKVIGYIKIKSIFKIHVPSTLRKFIKQQASIIQVL